MTTKTTHPIDHAIVALLFLVEGICWIVNELAGFHAEPEVIDPRDLVAIEAPIAVYEPTIAEMPDWDDYVDFHARVEQLATLTVVELRKQAKGLAKGVHLMRKAQLVELLA